MMKTCNETVYDSDAPPPTTPKAKRTRTTKSSGATTLSTQQSQIEGAGSVEIEETLAIAVTNSPAGNTRSRKRALVDEAEGLAQRKKMKKVTKTTVNKKIMMAIEGTSKRETTTANKRVGNTQCNAANKRVSKKRLVMDL